MASYADRVQARARARKIRLEFSPRGEYAGFPGGFATFDHDSDRKRIEISVPRDRLGYLCALHEEAHIVLRLSSCVGWIDKNPCYKYSKGRGWNAVEAEARCWIYAFDHYSKPIPRYTYDLILNRRDMYLRSYMDYWGVYDTPGVRKLKRMMKNAAV